MTHTFKPGDMVRPKPMEVDSIVGTAYYCITASGRPHYFDLSDIDPVPPPQDDVVEVMARAIDVAFKASLTVVQPGFWKTMTVGVLENPNNDLARAAIKALDAAGFKIVPKGDGK